MCETEMATFRIRLEHLRFPANIPAGMNPLVLMSLVYKLRSSSDDPEPIEVYRELDNTWRVHDGRHRAVAALIAGRPDVLCRYRHSGIPRQTRG
jgi:hypothetical protein